MTTLLGWGACIMHKVWGTPTIHRALLEPAVPSSCRAAAEIQASCQAALPVSCSPTHSPTLPMPGLSVPLLSSDAWLSSSNLIFHPSSGLLHLEDKERSNLCSSPAFVTASLLPLRHVAPSGYRTDPELYWGDSQVSTCITHPHPNTHTALSLSTIPDGQCFLS